MDRLEEIVASILMFEADSLPPDKTHLRDLKGWDSLKHVLLVVGLEKRLKTKLTAEEIRQLVTVADVRRILTEKAANA